MTTDYNHVLVATDMHYDDLPVVKKGVGLMKRNASHLTIVTVVPNVPYYMASGLSSVSDIEQQLEDDSAQRLTEIKEKVKVKAGCDVEYVVLHGSPKHEIVRYAKQIGADVVVIGSHGQNGVQRLLGSTVTGVLHCAPCDVMVVRIQG